MPRLLNFRLSARCADKRFFRMTIISISTQDRRDFVLCGCYAAFIEIAFAVFIVVYPRPLR